MRSFSIALISALAGSSIVAAFPAIPRNLPRSTTALAFDEATGKVIAFDDAGEIGRFDTRSEDHLVSRQSGGGCKEASVDEVKKIPGWKALEDKANSKWGKGKRKIVTNPEEYTDRPAMFCVTPDKATFKADKKPQCHDSTQQANASSTGTNGTVTLSYVSGNTYESSHTVTRQSEVGMDYKFEMGFKVSEAFNVGGSVSLNWKVTNSNADTKSEGQNDAQTQTAAIQVGDGKTCDLTWKVSTCSLKGKGKVPFVMKGWVWFNYDDKTHDHYKWALPIESTLTKEDDRTTYMEYEASVSSKANANAIMHCTKNGKVEDKKLN